MGSILDAEYQFENKDAVRDFFTRITGLYKNLNYAPDGSREYEDYEGKIRELAATARVSGS